VHRRADEEQEEDDGLREMLRSQTLNDESHGKPGTSRSIVERKRQRRIWRYFQPATRRGNHRATADSAATTRRSDHRPR
jgi:hypothetical protein